MKKQRMEINNISIDLRDDQTRNFFIEKVGDCDDIEIPERLADQPISMIDCNKRTNLNSMKAIGASIEEMM